MRKVKDEPAYRREYGVIEHLLYNPKYGDSRLCKCGHTYYRHFDPYDDMEAVGCKYCSCSEFEEMEIK